MGIILLFTDDIHFGVIPVLILFLLGGLLMLMVSDDKHTV